MMRKGANERRQEEWEKGRLGEAGDGGCVVEETHLQQVRRRRRRRRTREEGQEEGEETVLQAKHLTGPRTSWGQV